MHLQAHTQLRVSFRLRLRHEGSAKIDSARKDSGVKKRDAVMHSSQTQTSQNGAVAAGKRRMKDTDFCQIAAALRIS